VQGSFGSVGDDVFETWEDCSRVTVIKFGMYYGGCNDTGCFGIKIRTDAAKLMNVRITTFRECRDLIRECEMFVENEAKVTSTVSGVKRRVMYVT